MNKDILTSLNHIVKDEIFLCWVAENFNYWVKLELIPKELLEPKHVMELYDYLLKNQSWLVKISITELK